MSNQYGIKEVLNLQCFDLATGNPLYYIDYAETSEIDNKAQRLDGFGGQGAYKLISFDYQKLSSMKLKLPLVDTNLLASLMGDTVSTAIQNVFQREVVTVVAGVATLSQTPLAGVVPTAFYLSGSRDNGLPLAKVASAPTAAQFSITGSAMTFNIADNGKQVVVWYQYATPSTTTKFSMKANKFVTPMKLVGTGIVRDQITGQDKTSIITIYNARFKQDFNLTMAMSAMTSLDLELDMYATLQGNDQVYYDFVILT